MTRSFGHELREEFAFDKSYRPLNHGSFGAAPTCVLDQQQVIRRRCEEKPDLFLRYEYPSELISARKTVADVVNCPFEDLVLVQNATTGTNIVLLTAMTFEPGDEILYFSTSYGALEKTVLYVCAKTPATPVKVDINYPTSTEKILIDVEAQLKRGKTRIAVIDTISSLPSLRLPFEKLVKLCREYNCLSLVDGAHGVGCIPLDIRSFQPDFLTSNLHKWYYATRPNAFLYVAPSHQDKVASLPVSHGYPAPNIRTPWPKGEQQSLFEHQFTFIGTLDYSGPLCVQKALEFRESLGGDDAIFQYIHGLAADGGKLLAKLLGTQVLQGTEVEGIPMVNVRLPIPHHADSAMEVREQFETIMREEYHTFIATCVYADAWWARLSAQVFLDLSDFEYAARALKDVCARVGSVALVTEKTQETEK